MTHPCVILQHKRRDINLFRQDAGEELLEVFYVMDFLLHTRYSECGEEPRGHLTQLSTK